MLFKKKKVQEPTKPELRAVCSGIITEVAKLSDPVFAEKMLGDGYVLSDPQTDTVVSPATGKIFDVQKSEYAYGIMSGDGLKILVHVGINTGSMGDGGGFHSLVKEGQNVEAGQPIVKVDFGHLEQRGIPTSIAVIITNIEEVHEFECNYGKAVGGETVALTYVK